MAHVHHSHEGESLSTAARETMERSGEQWTAMRAAIFDALASFDKPASAYDIADKVSQSQGRRVAANSVYRILDLFVGANLARKVESANAYIANDHPDCLHDCIDSVSLVIPPITTIPNTKAATNSSQFAIPRGRGDIDRAGGAASSACDAMRAIWRCLARMQMQLYQ